MMLRLPYDLGCTLYWLPRDLGIIVAVIAQWPGYYILLATHKTWIFIPVHHPNVVFLLYHWIISSLLYVMLVCSASDRNRPLPLPSLVVPRSSSLRSGPGIGGLSDQASPKLPGQCLVVPPSPTTLMSPFPQHRTDDLEMRAQALSNSHAPSLHVPKSPIPTTYSTLHHKAGDEGDSTNALGSHSREASSTQSPIPTCRQPVTRTRSGSGEGNNQALSSYPSKETSPDQFAPSRFMYTFLKRKAGDDRAYDHASTTGPGESSQAQFPPVSHTSPAVRSSPGHDGASELAMKALYGEDFTRIQLSPVRSRYSALRRTSSNDSEDACPISARHSADSQFKRASRFSSRTASSIEEECSHCSDEQSRTSSQSQLSPVLSRNIVRLQESRFEGEDDYDHMSTVQSRKSSQGQTSPVSKRVSVGGRLSSSGDVCAEPTFSHSYHQRWPFKGTTKISPLVSTLTHST